MSFSEVDSVHDIDEKRPLILIHGWQYVTDFEGRKPHIDTWKNFIQFFYNDNQLNKEYALFTYRYDTDKSIYKNGMILRDTISTYFPDNNDIVLLCHSMGGLISHAYIQEYGGNNKLSKINNFGYTISWFSCYVCNKR